MLRIDRFEHFLQPSAWEAPPLCYPSAAPSAQMQQWRWEGYWSVLLSSSPTLELAGQLRSFRQRGLMLTSRTSRAKGRDTLDGALSSTRSPTATTSGTPTTPVVATPRR